MDKIRIFISYSHEENNIKDGESIYFKEIKTRLSLLKRDDPTLEIWDDGGIVPGQEWSLKIKEHLSQADIVLLLISAAFLDSVYINNVELVIANEKRKKHECVIIPIFVRNCLLAGRDDITILQGANPSDAFLSDVGAERDKYYSSIQKNIRQAADQVVYNRKRTIEAEGLERKRKIFLSIPESFDKESAAWKMREDILKEINIEGWNYQTLPSEEQVDRLFKIVDKDDRKDALLEIMNQGFNESFCFVYLIASEQEMADDVGYQYKKAKEIVRSPVVIWTKTSEIRDAFFKRDSSGNRNQVIVGMDFNDFHGRLAVLEAKNKNSVEGIRRELSQKKVFIMYDFEKDHQHRTRIELQRIINKHALVPPKAPKETRKQELQKLMECCGVVIFYGNSDLNWFSVRQDMLWGHKVLGIRQKGVIVDEPDVNTKIENLDVNFNQFEMKGVLIDDPGHADRFSEFDIKPFERRNLKEVVIEWLSKL